MFPQQAVKYELFKDTTSCICSEARLNLRWRMEGTDKSSRSVIVDARRRQALILCASKTRSSLNLSNSVVTLVLYDAPVLHDSRVFDDPLRRDITLNGANALFALTLLAFAQLLSIG